MIINDLPFNLFISLSIHIYLYAISSNNLNEFVVLVWLLYTALLSQAKKLKKVYGD